MITDHNHDIERLRVELARCRDIRSEAVARLMEGAAFLDGLADDIRIGDISHKNATACRAMAKRLRGER